MKLCLNCKVEKQESEYYTNPNGNLRNPCKTCAKARAKKSNEGRTYENFHKAWYEKNKDKAVVSRAKWASKPHVKARRASKQKQREFLKKSTFELSEEHQKQIEYIYLHAKDCELVSGEKYHVDHIVPLNGENICGLHVPWNLQVLPADINIRKSNKHV